MVNEQTLESMTVPVTMLGLHAPVAAEHWPTSFKRRGKTYTKDHLTVAANGDVQCGEYVAEDGDWLIVYNSDEE